MRKARRAIAVATVASLLALGCGGGSGTETVEFKKTDSAQFDQMKDMMTKQVKTKNYKGQDPPKNAETK